MALVITIIVLLILAGITLNITIGENGIIKIDLLAGEEYKRTEKEDLEELERLYSQIKVATGDGSQIVVNMEDLNRIIDLKVDAKIKDSNVRTNRYYYFLYGK